MSKSIYRGGNISPGLSTRLRALHEFTGRLPLIQTSGEFTDPGINTRDAILAGVVKGVSYEINEYIRTFEKKHPDARVILTGGDSGFLKNRISHHVKHLPDIVVEGLNYILEYNAK
jgi:type III pantothenate kinase